MAKPLDFLYDFGNPEGYRLSVSPGWLIIPGDDERAKGQLVQVGANAYPKRFSTQVASETEDFHAVVMFLADGDAGEIRLAAALSTHFEADETLKRLRSIRDIAWWKNHAILGLRFWEARDEAEHDSALWDGTGLTDAGADYLINEVRRAQHGSPVKTRQRMSDDLAREIAHVYRKAWEAGENPTQAVAAFYDKPYSTAARWVGEARKRGQLGPADGSRGGEKASPDSPGK